MRVGKLLWVLIALAVIVAAIKVWHFARPLPFIHLWLRLPVRFAFERELTPITDWDGDGNEDLIGSEFTIRIFGGSIQTTPTRNWWLTMKQGKLAAIPLPLPLRKLSVGEGYMVGETEQGTIAIVRSGQKWQVQSLKVKVLAYDVGDMDGNGKNDDLALLVCNGNPKVLVLNIKPDGKWKQVANLPLTVPLGGNWLLSVGYCQAEVLQSTPKFNRFAMVFWDGRWKLARERSWVYRCDFDGDGQLDRLLVQWQPQRLLLDLRRFVAPTTFRQERLFRGWFLISCIPTDFSDRRSHLLLLMRDKQNQQMRLVDGSFTLPSGWQWKELTRWKASLSADAVAEVNSGDADGDGDTDLTVRLFEPLRRKETFWLLQLMEKGWTVSQIPFQTTKSLSIGKRLWFARTVTQTRWVGPQWHYIFPHQVFEAVTELGTFSPDGHWQPLVSMKGELVAWDDLNDDGVPEVLVRNPRGLEPLEPAWFWRRLPNGRWQGDPLPLPKWSRIAIGLWREISKDWELGTYFNTALTVRWDNKKWFVVFWRDGVVQAVTVP